MKNKNIGGVFINGFKIILADYFSSVLLAKQNNKIDSLNEGLVKNLRKIIDEYDLNNQRYKNKTSTRTDVIIIKETH